MTDAPLPEDPRDALIREQAAQLLARDARIAVLEERAAAQDERIAELSVQLEAALRAGSRNSGNSSMPPSGDDRPGKKPPRKQRRAAERAEGKRKPGKQPGSPGAAMRSGPAGDNKYVHGAFTELYSCFHLGTRSLETMKAAGILPFFAGIVVSGRYVNYFSGTWTTFAGNQACCAHILRDFQDCAETYPAAWAGQAQRALRGLIRAWHQAREQGLPAIPDETRLPLELEFRRAVTVGLSAVPRVPGPKNSTKQKPGRDMLEFCRPRGRPW